VVNGDLVHAVEASREQTIHHFVPFPALSSNFTVTSSQNTSFSEIVFTLGTEDAYGQTQIETAGQCVDLPDTIQ
jgi:hypothetical protein